MICVCFAWKTSPDFTWFLFYSWHIILDYKKIMSPFYKMGHIVFVAVRSADDTYFLWQSKNNSLEICNIWYFLFNIWWDFKCSGIERDSLDCTFLCFKGGKFCFNVFTKCKIMRQSWLFIFKLRYCEKATKFEKWRFFTNTFSFSDHI